METISLKRLYFQRKYRMLASSHQKPTVLMWRRWSWCLVWKDELEITRLKKSRLK